MENMTPPPREIVNYIDHIAVMVPDISDALPLFQGVLGGKFVVGGNDLDRGFRTMQLSFPGGMKIELIAPVNEASNVQQRLEKYGPGFHHLTFIVKDINVALEALSSAGIETTGSDLLHPVWQETYIRPSAGFGTLIQLVQSTERWSEPYPGITQEMVLEGRVDWDESGLPVLRP
jgi:methylmalonyl-CoA/ethylmalonyl-CoA epimerase